MGCYAPTRPRGWEPVPAPDIPATSAPGRETAETAKIATVVETVETAETGETAEIAEIAATAETAATNKHPPVGDAGGAGRRPRRVLATPLKWREIMAGSGPRKSDSSVDAIATVLVISVVVASVSLWLAGMPA